MIEVVLVGDSRNMALDRKLTELFGIFQDKEKNVVEVKDIPTILRALGKLSFIKEFTHHYILNFDNK